MKVVVGSQVSFLIKIKFTVTIIDWEHMHVDILEMEVLRLVNSLNAVEMVRV